MRNFEYYTPTKVFFGKRQEEQAGNILKSYGAKKVLILYGGSSAKRSGLLNRVTAVLQEAGLECLSFGGIQPNPRLSHVHQAIALCREEKADFLLAVGGGSVIDEAKAVGMGQFYDGDVWDILTGKAPCMGCLPVGVILTIAASGSEMSDSLVITNEEGLYKIGFHDDRVRPKFAIMNPELTFTLPAYQTASGVVDIMMHTLERYFNPKAEDDFTDSFSESLLRNVMRNGRILKESPHDYKARFEVMWAGSLAHNGLLAAGNGPGDWGTHKLEHEVGALFDVAHGAGLAALWGSWARYVYRKEPARFARLSRNVFHIAEEDDKKTAFAGIAAMEDYFRSIKMPTTLKELGVVPTEEQIVEMADKCTHGDTIRIGLFGLLEKDDIIKIYKMAR